MVRVTEVDLIARHLAREWGVPVADVAIRTVEHDDFRIEIEGTYTAPYDPQRLPQGPTFVFEDATILARSVRVRHPNCGGHVHLRWSRALGERIDFRSVGFSTTGELDMLRTGRDLLRKVIARGGRPRDDRSALTRDFLARLPGALDKAWDKRDEDGSTWIRQEDVAAALGWSDDTLQNRLRDAGLEWDSDVKPRRSPELVEFLRLFREN